MECNLSMGEEINVLNQPMDIQLGQDMKSKLGTGRITLALNEHLNAPGMEQMSIFSPRMNHNSLKIFICLHVIRLSKIMWEPY